MKRIMASAVIAAAAVTGTAFADSGPGCGWGTMIFKGQSGLFAHTLAATTNGTSYNQWFGLTSGTGGCDATVVVSNEYQRKIFVASNMDSLSQDMAQGRGDHLDALASLLSISEADKPGFYSLTQANLPQIMAAADQGAADVLAVLDGAMSADPVLAKYVR